MAMQKTVTVKVTPETLAQIQWLSQETREKQYGLIARLVDKEFQRVERLKTTRPDWNRV